MKTEEQTLDPIGDDKMNKSTQNASASFHAFLVQLPNANAHERAVEALLKVPQPRQVFPDHCMLLTREHIEVLERENIPFVDITDSEEKNGQAQKT